MINTKYIYTSKRCSRDTGKKGAKGTHYMRSCMQTQSLNDNEGKL